jgi:hypothetical protein
MKKYLPLLPLAFLISQLDSAPGLPPSRHVAKDLAEVVAALPPRDEGRFGRHGDTLNIVFVGSPQAVHEALSKGGWTPLPRGCAESFFTGLKELWLGKPLKSFPPMQAYKVMGRVQDMNWAIALNAMDTRHHFRLWRTGIHDVKGRELFWGSGNFDLTIRWRDLSHVPDPDMSIEPAKILETLAGSPLVESTQFLPVPQVPLTGKNDNGYPWKHSGKALVVVLKS